MTLKTIVRLLSEDFKGIVEVRIYYFNLFFESDIELEYVAFRLGNFITAELWKSFRCIFNLLTWDVLHITWEIQNLSGFLSELEEAGLTCNRDLKACRQLRVIFTFLTVSQQFQEAKLSSSAKLWGGVVKNWIKTTSFLTSDFAKETLWQPLFSSVRRWRNKKVVTPTIFCEIDQRTKTVKWKQSP